MNIDTAANQLIRKGGFRATHTRLLLVKCLQKARSPLSVQEIAHALRRERIDTVTIYRTIESFAKAGIVREVNLQGQPRRFELSGDDHHHIVCTGCNKVEDFVGCDYQKVEKTALRHSRSFATITAHSFDLYGLCNACAA